MLVTRGRGYRPRVGLPLGHPGPVCRQTEQDEEEHVAAVSGRGPRTALHGVTGTARLRRVDGSLRKPGRPGGWTLGHHPGRSPCALAALQLFAPVLPGLGYGLALATARHGPDHEASPCARHAAGPRTDSDGTSPIAFTTAQMGGDCARTELLRNVPNRKTHASGPGGSRVFHIRPARGPRPPGTSTSSRPLRARIDPNNTCGATTRILLPVMFTRRTTGGITTETVICALTHRHIKGEIRTRDRGNNASASALAGSEFLIRIPCAVTPLPARLAPILSEIGVPAVAGSCGK